MVKVISRDDQFQPELANAGAKLVVCNFFASWASACREIDPKFEEMTANYPNAVFLKVDVDKCQTVAQHYHVSSMPTFLFVRSLIEIDKLPQPTADALQQKIDKWYNASDVEAGDVEESDAVKGHMDMKSFITRSGCECLNESDEHPFDHLLSSKGGFLESDCDEQLIIAFAFNQPVKLHSMRINGPPDKGPKNVKLFINQPATLDFDKAESMAPVQFFELKPEDIENGSIIQLRFVKYQNVQNITVFVKDNQTDQETTQIDKLTFYGSPINTTNMSEFKRVAGKKGESE